MGTLSLRGKHGKRSTYTHLMCRCAKCTAANTKYIMARYRRIAAELRASKIVTQTPV